MPSLERYVDTDKSNNMNQHEHGLLDLDVQS